MLTCQAQSEKSCLFCDTSLSIILLLNGSDTWQIVRLMTLIFYLEMFVCDSICKACSGVGRIKWKTELGKLAIFYLTIIIADIFVLRISIQAQQLIPVRLVILAAIIALMELQSGVLLVTYKFTYTGICP